MIENCTFKILDSEIRASDFDCGEEDLNDFFRKDAKHYSEELLAKTYQFLHQKKIVALFSVANDSLGLEAVDRPAVNRINRQIPNKKRRQVYPAVKLARLGVNKPHQGQGVGKEVIEFIKAWFTGENKTGCRFLLVDAYNKENVISFYEKNDFVFLLESDEGKSTRQMFYDLKRFA